MEARDSNVEMVQSQEIRETERAFPKRRPVRRSLRIYRGGGRDADS